MNNTNDPLMRDVDAAIQSLKPAKHKRPDLSPDQWEALAKYVEAKYRIAELRAVQGEELLRQGLGGAGLEGQVMFWRSTAAVAKKIAYDFRIGRNGPWNLKATREKAS